jgi:hypothetical protein
MNIPQDLQGMYNHYLELATKEVEHVQISPEMMLTLIERIGDLETDSVNLESYIHYECKKKIGREKQHVDDLASEITDLQHELQKMKIEVLGELVKYDQELNI